MTLLHSSEMFPHLAVTSTEGEVLELPDALDAQQDTAAAAPSNRQPTAPRRNLS